MRKNALRSLVVMMIAVMVVAMMPVTASAATKAPAKVKITSVKVAAVSTATNKTTVTVKWKKAKRATGYIINVKQGNEELFKKKVGRMYRKLKLKNVPAGQISITVRAVNKKKLGKSSAIKTRFITSPLTLQQYVERVEPSMIGKSIGLGKAAFSGNTMVVTYDVFSIYNNAAEVDWNNLTESDKEELRSYLINEARAKEQADYYRNRAKLYCGITTFAYTARIVYQGNILASVTY